MRLDEFDFDLPRESVAQVPLERRDRARLMVLERGAATVTHRRVVDLPELLDPGDLLVLNDTRVLPARLIGRKSSGGRVELLLLEPEEGGEAGEIWRCLLKAARAAAPGTRLAFGDALRAEVLGRDEDGFRVRLDARGGTLAAALERVGHMPLPPYIRRDEAGEAGADDRRRYQTVFATRPGAIAAPTAGLHFTRGLLRTLAGRGIETGTLTLHVGIGTFLPVRVDRIEEHRMHSERFELPAGLAERIEQTRSRGGRVVAVGTTVVRCLEHMALGRGRVRAGSGRCDLFLYPGSRFRVVDAMLTNFHLPRSTLLMLVAAFAGRETVLDAYREAVRCGYRFYSYGDAMLVR